MPADPLTSPATQKRDPFIAGIVLLLWVLLGIFVLYPLARLYRSRMLVWAANEYGNILGYHDERRKFFDKAVEDFRAARAAFPANRIPGMYLGEPIPSTETYASPPAAPHANSASIPDGAASR